MIDLSEFNAKVPEEWMGNSVDARVVRVWHFVTGPTVGTSCLLEGGETIFSLVEPEGGRHVRFGPVNGWVPEVAFVGTPTDSPAHRQIWDTIVGAAIVRAHDQNPKGAGDEK